ncbi:hypothetical protein SAMN02745857_04267 [Andreprevotia lacus DSM 23236]|jgi:hypothetical protein|uniref:Uncharacterized protein n=1 Tax=Andreprevotia lacus DSM 23236 TaxID=1121001 RepID=A0A1W1Y1C5_9NEIS|nr:hypothetical protein [Andreprevotia lacus]SMC29924.1 hypothetical protein SAMN02745857_04267 [Andreprevotia lacus DSM 23236]
MQLPAGIEQELVDYLHLEQGEDAADPNATRVEDLRYEGLFEVDGVPTHFWRVGPGNENWVTVEPRGYAYCIGSTSATPLPVRKADYYKTLQVTELRNGTQHRFALEHHGGGDYELADETPLTLSNGSVLLLYATANSQSAPPMLFLHLTEGDKEYHVSSALFFNASYTTECGEMLVFELGYRPDATDWQA